MRYILLISTLIISASSMASEKVTYANIYANALIEQFDDLLDEKIIFPSSTNILYSKVYAKLLSARKFIESFHEAFEHRVGNGKENLLMIKNSQSYANVVREIDANAELIYEERQNSLKSNISKTPVIYPSTTWDGNVSGTKFPKNVWSLTFDDGPKKGRTEAIVDNLYRHSMKASFFMLVDKVKKSFDSATYVKNSGMEIALHSYTHPSLNKVSSNRLEYEVTQAKLDLENILSINIDLFRLPYGAGIRTNNVRQKIADNKMIHIFWNVDTLDWKDKNPQSIKARTIKQMKLTKNNAGVILFHDIHAQTVVASELIMQHLNDKNYKVCTVGDVIKYKNGLEQNCVE